MSPVAFFDWPRALSDEQNAPYALVPHLYDDEIDVDQLGGVLKRGLLSTEEGSEEGKRLLKDSAFRKCVRMYDFLRYSGS